MAGIGEILREERRRQGRTLADAAAETRVRESYLAALESEDFAILGGDVYARGFIRLYGRYLDLDAEALVQDYRRHHERPEEITAIPGATIDEILPAPGGRLVLSKATYAAVGLVALLVVLFIVARGGSDDPSEAEDSNAAGPQPADVESNLPVASTDDPLTAMADDPANPLVPGGSEAPLDGPTNAALDIVVRVVRPVRISVSQGQPPMQNASLEEGDVRNLTGDQMVVFTVSDATAVEILINDLPLAPPGGDGQAVQISCAIGEVGCRARVL